MLTLYIQQDATLHSLFYLETALHVSGGISIHHQERKNVCIPRCFLVINVCNQGKTLCSPCISNKMQRYTVYFIWKLLYMFRVVRNCHAVTATCRCGGR